MDLQLSGQVAIVTGSSRGIGAGIARILAAEGVSVVLNCSRDLERAESVRKDIEKSGGRAAVCQANVTDPAAAESLVQFAVERFGGLDILINNAGGGVKVPFLQTTQEELDRMLNVNFRSIWNCSQAAAKYMIQKCYGRIVNCSSFAALTPHSKHAAYAASKAAVLSLTRSMAGELAPYNVLVNAYVPGAIATERTMASVERRGGTALESIGLRRYGKPEEVGALVAFLVSPLNGYMTGAMIRVDGGKLAVQNPSTPWQDAGLLE
jgi:3-oxoacyl-[acyl-carrier protein] reductase